MTTVGKMNEMLALDPEAMANLIELHVKVNENIAGHPTITVTPESELGILGVLRYVSGEKIAAVMDGDGKIVEFVDTANW